MNDLILVTKTYFVVLYHEDLEKRGGCGVVVRERHDSHMSH